MEIKEILLEIQLKLSLKVDSKIAKRIDLGGSADIIDLI